MTRYSVVLLALGAASGCKSRPSPPPARPGFEDCDKNSENGAETDIKNDAKHCGSCGKACVAGAGSSACVSGECKPVCQRGWAACGTPEEGCNAKLATAANHCGRCGQRCIGYCREGRCIDPEVLEADIFSYGILLQDGKFVYLSRAGQGEHYYRRPLAGGALEKVPLAVSFMPLAFDGKDLFGCRETKEVRPKGDLRWGTCELLRAPAAGGAPKPVTKIERFALGTIAVSGETLYYGTLVAEPTSDDGAIHALPLAGGEPRLVVKTQDPLSVTASGASVFYSSGGSRSKQHKDAGVFRTDGSGSPVELHNGRARHLVLDGDWLYFEADDSVMRIARGGGKPEIVVTPPPRSRGGIYGIAITPSHVYYALRGKDVAFRTLARIEKPGPS